MCLCLTVEWTNALLGTIHFHTLHVTTSVGPRNAVLGPAPETTYDPVYTACSTGSNVKQIWASTAEKWCLQYHEIFNSHTKKCLQSDMHPTLFMFSYSPTTALDWRSLHCLLWKKTCAVLMQYAGSLRQCYHVLLHRVVLSGSSFSLSSSLNTLWSSVGQFKEDIWWCSVLFCFLLLFPKGRPLLVAGMQLDSHSGGHMSISKCRKNVCIIWHLFVFSRNEK